MEEQKEFQEVVNIIVSTISKYNKMWSNAKMIFAVCCSEGSYRSPMVVESVAKKLKENKISVKVEHPFKN